MAPDPAVWLALDEADRLELIEDYHRRVRIELPNLALHAAIQTTVENQVAAGDELPVRRTVERLMREGLDRHDALHAVGGEFLAHLSALAQPSGGAVGRSGDTAEAALTRYKAAVEALSASRWMDGADAGSDDAPLRFAEAWPILDPMRKVGRNDPCPCGSGKKYKKCCLR